MLVVPFHNGSPYNVVDNHQVQDLADSKSFVAYKVATPVVMVTNVVYAVVFHATNAQATWNSAHTIAYTGPHRDEYLIFASTEEWSRLLFALGEAPTEGVN